MLCRKICVMLAAAAGQYPVPQPVLAESSLKPPNFLCGKARGMESNQLKSRAASYRRPGLKYWSTNY
jgi:hypothetical protein